MYILRTFKITFQFVLKSERSQELTATKMASKEQRVPSPKGTQPTRKAVRYRQKREQDDEAYEAINTGLSTVQGAAVLMAAAALKTAGNPDRQGARIWGQLARNSKRHATDRGSATWI